MPIEAGQIYLVRDAGLEKANYARPCSVVRVMGARVLVCYFSTKFELMAPGDLSIYDDDPDFPATGLKESSYLLADRDLTVECSFFAQTKLIDRLSGLFKKRVEDWDGEPI